MAAAEKEAEKEEEKGEAKEKQKEKRPKETKEKRPKETKEKKGKEEKVEEKPLSNLLLFGRWDLSQVEVRDPGLKRYINLSPTFLPHTGGRYANRPFAKARVNLVERLTNNMMRTEQYTGKKSKTIKVVQLAFEIVEKRAKKNPVQVLVEALENAAPREEITRLRFGGISVPRAVDIAPARRLDLALRHICVGAVQATYKSPKPIHECLANEILLASKGDMSSHSIGKKEELERVAASAR